MTKAWVMYNFTEMYDWFHDNEQQKAPARTGAFS